MPVKAFQVLCLFCYLLNIPTVAGLLNFGSKKQQREPNRQRRPFPTPQTPPPPPPPSSFLSPTFPKVVGEGDDFDATGPVPPALWNSATSSLLSLAASLAPKQVPNQTWTETSARLTINNLPPQSVEIDLQDVPLIGKALSGTFVKINPRSSQTQKTLSNKPSIQIGSPPDKLGALQNVADTGKLQFGLDGILQSSLDIQLQPNQPGVAPLEIKSPLIPKWPFGRRKSDWSQVTNLGNGEIYFFNAKTGETTLEKPDDV